MFASRKMQPESWIQLLSILEDLIFLWMLQLEIFWWNQKIYPPMVFEQVCICIGASPYVICRWLALSTFVIIDLQLLCRCNFYCSHQHHYAWTHNISILGQITDVLILCHVPVPSPVICKALVCSLGKESLHDGFNYKVLPIFYGLFAFYAWDGKWVLHL